MLPMGIKQERVSMPMSSAGMIGFSPDVRIEGQEIDPKALIVATILLVIVVKVASHFTIY